jgi:hypothetical protein
MPKVKDLKDKYGKDLSKLLTPICRNCDIPMTFETENPKGYFLYKCRCCNNRTGLSIVK